MKDTSSGAEILTSPSDDLATEMFQFCAFDGTSKLAETLTLSPRHPPPASDYVVRDLVREHSGWRVSKNPTDLHPAPPDEAALAVFAAIDPTGRGAGDV